MNKIPLYLRTLGLVAAVGLTGACDDGDQTQNIPSATGGTSGASGGRGGGGGRGGAGGAGGSQAAVMGVGEIDGGSDGGAATSVMSDASINTGDNDPAKPADAAVADVGSNPVPGGGAEAEWTVFVYGHADHNLSPSMAKDLTEMSQAKLNDKVQVIALVDYNASLENEEDKKFPTGLIWYRIVGNGQPPKEIAKTSERNLDDPSILATAVHQAFKAYPAKRYGLILWDHGGAWLSGFGGDTEDGTKEGEGMAVQSVANALRESVRALGLKGEKPLEFLTFDTCLMGGAEEVAAYEGIAKVYTANAEIDFGDGLDYTKTLTYLAENPTVSALEFAKNEVSFWDAHHAAAGGLDAFFRSHAVWDTTKTPKLGESMKALAKAIGDAKQEKAVARALYLSSPEYFAGSTDDSSVALRDLGNVLQSLKGGENQSVGSAAARVIEDINSARVGLSAGDLRKDQAGLHIFGGPVANLGDEHMEAYPILAGAWEKATGWRDGVLSKLKSAAPKAIDKVTATLANASSGTDKAATLTINSPSADTVYIEGLLMQDAPKGDDLVLGTIGHGFVGPGESRIRWNGQATYLVASPKNIPVTVQPWTFTQQGQAIRTPFMSVEGLLSAPEEEPMKAFALMNGDTGLATHIVLETDASSYVVMTLAELAGMGEVTFTPVLTTFNADKEDLGEVPSPTGVQVPASGQLQFRREPVPAGKYFILGYAEDFWGNGDFEAQGVELTRP